MLEQTMDVHALRELPVGSVLRGPRGTLIEIAARRYVHPERKQVRENGSATEFEWLYPDADFPMTLLYRGEPVDG